MRFLTRSLMAMCLLFVTLGVLGLAGKTLSDAMIAKKENASKPRAARERVFAVNVAPIKFQDVAPVITTFGEVVSGKTLELRARGAGSLVMLSPNFRDGARVSKGDLLFQSDPAALTAAMQLAQAELSEAQAELSEAKAALILSQDELAAAREQSELRQQSLRRQESLRKRKVGTESALETAELSASSAKQAVLAKRQLLANAQSRINRAEIALSRRQINFNEAERKLNDTSVYAEFDGVLSDITAVLGGLVNTNERQGMLIDDSALEVSFRISSTQFANISAAETGIAGAKVDVAFTGLEKPIKATIDRVSAAVGEGQTGRELFAKLEQGINSGLRPGDFVAVSITEPIMSNVALVPSAAVSSTGELLLVGENNRLETANVRILRKQGNSVLITGEGIDGRQLVQERAPQLGDGIRIEPRSTDTPILTKQETVKLSAQEQAQMIAAVKAGGMPQNVKDRILKNLETGELKKASYDRLKSRLGDTNDAGVEEVTVKLNADQQAKLKAFVTENASIPAAAKDRMLASIASGSMPKKMYDRLTSNMGG